MENQNNTNETYVNLISRLKARFHNHQIAKRVAGLVLAGALLVAPVGCSKQNNNSNNNNTNNNYQNSQQDDYNNSNNNSNNNSTTEKESQYSQMLLNVLNDEHYNSLIEQAKTNKDVYTRGEFKPHPYAFLEDEGFDVNAIMNDNLKCISFVYSLKDEPNVLYVITRAETASSEPYFTQYVLKYTLSKQEMADYKMLHEGFFAQACFLVNEISELHDPQVLSKTKITVQAQTSLSNSIKKYEEGKTLLGGSSIGFSALTDFSVENGTFKVLATTGVSLGETMLNNGKMNILNLKEYAFNVKENADGAFWSPCGYKDYKFDENQKTAQDIIIYQPNINYSEKMKNYEIK